MSSLPAVVIRPVILCGGAGTRLWPVSREQVPKQLLPLMGDASLLQQTVKRLSGAQFKPAVVVSSEDQGVLVERQLRDVDAPVEAILLEPIGRNTAPAAMLAAAWLEAAGEDEIMLLMPSDHVIGNPDAFVRAIEIGIRHAQDGAIVTFGAEPTEPNSQYGYIEADGRRQVGNGAYRIAHFHEKPSTELAAQYLATGKFFWNCGIFLAKASTILSETRRFLPQSLRSISEAVNGAAHDGTFVRPVADLFARAENISIDNGVMEKTSRGIVVPVQMQWSDVGAWDAVWKLSEKDASGNAIQGEVFAMDCSNSLFRNESRAVVGTLGLEGMAVIALDDAVFVAPLERASEVKQFVAELNRDGPIMADPASGSIRQLGQGPGFEVSYRVVQPSEILCQTATAGARQWVIVSGSAQVSLGGELSELKEQDSVLIAAGTDHALANRGSVPVSLIEVHFAP